MIAVIQQPPGGAPMPVIVAQPYAEFNPGNESWSKTKRGMLHLRDDFNRCLAFQFNPTELSFNKRNYFEMLRYTGRSGVDPIWLGGDVKTIQFVLMVDKTTCSIYDYVGGNSTIEAVSRENLYYVGSKVLDENRRGTLEVVEMLESFEYPIGTFKTEWFKDGMAKMTDQFVPPPDLIFTFGEFYMVCKLTELSVVHKLFNRNLIPVRTECSITLTVKENESEIVDTSTFVNPSPDSRQLL